MESPALGLDVRLKRESCSAYRRGDLTGFRAYFRS